MVLELKPELARRQALERALEVASQPPLTQVAEAAKPQERDRVAQGTDLTQALARVQSPVLEVFCPAHVRAQLLRRGS